MRRAKFVPSITIIIFLMTASVSWAAGWSGVDDTVVGKYAAQQGRPARSPLIDIEQGDLPLFIFTAAGVLGGFVAGYYWRKLFGEKGERDSITRIEV